MWQFYCALRALLKHSSVLYAEGSEASHDSVSWCFLSPHCIAVVVLSRTRAATASQVVCTIGPACWEVPTLIEMIDKCVRGAQRRDSANASPRRQRFRLQGHERGTPELLSWRPSCA